MGLTSGGALSSRILAENRLSWRVPDEWSLEDATTVPVVYCTMLYGLVMVSSSFFQ